MGDDAALPELGAVVAWVPGTKKEWICTLHLLVNSNSNAQPWSRIGTDNFVLQLTRIMRIGGSRLRSWFLALRGLMTVARSGKNVGLSARKLGKCSDLLQPHIVLLQSGLQRG